MADTKLTALAALTGANVATGDLALAVDVSDATMDAAGTDKKITFDELCIAVATTLGVVGRDKIFDAAGDVVVGTGADAAARLAVGTLGGQALAADPNATNKLSWNYPLGVDSATRGLAGSFASTFDRATVGLVASAVLVSGRLAASRIFLPKGAAVTSITFVTSTTAAATLTNQVFGLLDSSRVVLAKTADDTSTAWAANTAKTLTVTSGPFITTYTGWYYVAIAVAATTVPTLMSSASLNAWATAAVPIAVGVSNTGLTNPASWPSTATALTATGNPLYAEVS